MKHSRVKNIGGILLLLAFTAVFGLILFHTYQAVNRTRFSEERTARIGILKTNAEKAMDLYRQVCDSVDKTYLAKAELSAASYRKLSESGLEVTPKLVDSGAIVRIRDGKITVPDGFPETVALDAGMFTEDSGTVTSVSTGPEETEDGRRNYTIYYSRIGDGDYYIEWEDTEAQSLRQLNRFNIYNSLEGTKKIFNSYVMVADTSFPASCIFRSDGLETAFPGLEEEVLKALPEGPAEMDATAPIRLKSGRVDVDLFILKDDDLHVAIAYLLPQEQNHAAALEQAGILSVVFLIISVVFLVWIFSMTGIVRKHTLNESQKKAFGFKRVRRVAAGFLLAGSLVILIVSALYQCLFRFYEKYDTVGKTIEVLQENIAEYNSRREAARVTQSMTYEECTKAIAGLLSEYPELRTPEQLQAYCDILRTDYLMIFDQNGKEILTNSRYRGLALGTDPEDSSSDFRRLLAGVPSIFHPTETDPVTGLYQMKVGASIAPKDPDGTYEALIMTVPYSRMAEGNPQTASSIMAEFVTGSSLAFTVDPETFLIKDSNRSELIWENIVHEGLPQSFLHDDLKDFFTIGGKQYYGEAQADENGLLYFCAVEKGDMYSGVFVYALICTGLFLVFMSVLILYTLHGYEKIFRAYADRGEELRDYSNELTLSGGIRKRSVDPSGRWLPSFADYGDRKPVHNAMLALQIMLTACAVATAVQLFAYDNGARIPLLTYIFKGQWAKGFNLFAVISILILMTEVIAVLILLKGIIRLISTMTGTRGETICRLLLNLMNYVGVIVFLFFSLQYLGFDVSTLLASLGLLTFAISLGAKDLITDVLAGISIIFEGDYQVGDIIEVNGYWGEVLEIGVRTTKIEGLGGNIKIIGNRNVSNILNKTRKNSWYALEIGVSFEQFEETETLLKEELPGIGERIPEIISGPYYKGIESFGSSMGNSFVRLSIIAECREEDFRHVRHELNHAIKELFDEHQLKIL